MTSALVIIGPTASGKTALALHLAQRFNGEIISLDSALVYRHMDIGTAKPSAAQLKLIPHHLIDIIEPWESFSAAQFREECISLVEEISSRGRLPIICGGTMMYYKALVDGLSPLPGTDLKIREQVAAEAEVHGWPYMHAKLKDIDPTLYLKLSANDRQRISRALEVYAMTGRSMSSFFAAKSGQCPFSRHEILLLPEKDRSQLREVIRERFLRMLDSGLIDEVKALKALPQLNVELPSMRSVGYRQVWSYLDGQYNYEAMIEQAVIATARLAKHQMTWIRGGFSAPPEAGNTRLILSPYELDLYDKGEAFVRASYQSAKGC